MSISEFSQAYNALFLTEEQQYQVENRQFEKRHRIEQCLCNCVRSGDVDGLKELINPGTLGPGALLSKNALGAARTEFITTLCLVSRSAVDGGMPIELSYPLSDIYLLRMEELTDIDQIFHFLENCIIDFTTRVRDYHIQYQQNKCYSALIQRTQSIVISQIIEPLSIAGIAAQLNVTPDYLAKRFLSETGERLTLYIKKRRVEESCRLLTDSTFSLAQIAYRMGFSSQSLFTRQFREITGITPGQFRKASRSASFKTVADN